VIMVVAERTKLDRLSRMDEVHALGT